MAFIKVETEDMAIEEAFAVKREDSERMCVKEEREEVAIEKDFTVKQEDAEGHTEMPSVKEERRELTIEDVFRIKQEDSEEHAETAFIKQERDEETTEDVFRVKEEDTGEHTGHVPCGPAIRPYMFEPESDPEPEEDEKITPRTLQPVSAWCTCRNCAVMPAEKDNVCCQEIPQVVRRMNQAPDALTCMTLHPGFEPVCLNVYSLQNALNVYEADYGRLKVKGREGRCRLLARRSFVSWCWGSLSRTVGVTVPSCVVLRINREFADLRSTEHLP